MLTKRLNLLMKMNRFVIFILVVLLVSPVYAGRARANKTVIKYTEDDTIAEIRFGRNLAARILGEIKTWDNEKVSDYVNIIGTALASQMGRPDLKFKFAVLDSPEINAYAIPGGYIFITRGAIQLMENEAQLVGALAHEIAHINHRHIVKKINLRGQSNAFLSSLGVAAGGGAVSGATLLDKLLDEAADLLFEIGVEKKFETDSDLEAVKIMIALNYDWRSYVRFLEKIDNETYQNRRTINSKTHPPLAERIEQIEAEAGKFATETFNGRKHQKRFHEKTH